MKYEICLSNGILEMYHKEYFEKYPKRHVQPLKSPFPPSLNRFTAMKRIVQNSEKQKYKEFAIWLASYYKIANLNLDRNITITYSFYFKDHRRRDVDNTILVSKFFNDGFVASKVMVDDDGERVRLVFDIFKYDKNNPRCVMVIDDGMGDG